jgi:hypothetical protein
MGKGVKWDAPTWEATALAPAQKVRRIRLSESGLAAPSCSLFPYSRTPMPSAFILR